MTEREEMLELLEHASTLTSDGIEGDRIIDTHHHLPGAPPMTPPTLDLEALAAYLHDRQHHGHGPYPAEIPHSDLAELIRRARDLERFKAEAELRELHAARELIDRLEKLSMVWQVSAASLPNGDRHRTALLLCAAQLNAVLSPTQKSERTRARNQNGESRGGSHCPLRNSPR